MKTAMENTVMKTDAKTLFSGVLSACAVVSLAGAVGFLGSGCTKVSQAELHKEPNVELIQDMMEQAALKPQDFEPANRDQASSLLPPEGTVPVGYKPYPYHLDAAAAAERT